MTQFHAQPYDLSAAGFYFENAEEYKTKFKAARNSYGELVEEFEIQFIDGETIDAETCEAIGLYQNNILSIMEKLEEWSDHGKTNIILAVGECSYDFDAENDDPETYFDITIYNAETYRDLAYEMVEEGLFGDIPDHLENYIDYDAIARDLEIDYSEATVNGCNIIYNCH